MGRKAAGVYIDKNGLYQCRFTVNGKRYAVYGHSLNECREKESEKRKQIKDGINSKPRKEWTVSDFFGRWIEAKRDTVKETTLLYNRNRFKSIEKRTVYGQAFGKMKLSAVKTQDIRELQNGLKEEYSTNTINQIMAMLSSMFKTAVNERYLIWNPCDEIRFLKRNEPKARDTIHRALSVEETGRFLDAARESWFYNLYVFLLHTGCRIGEAGALLPGDIDNSGIRVCRTITQAENGGFIIGKDTKTGAGKRFIPLDDEARAAINRQKAVNMAFDKVIDLQQPVFRTTYGALLIAITVNRDIAKCCQAAGMERFTVHAFRDTFATRCVESGMQPKVLQDIMGHSDINMTMNLYAHSMDESKMDQLKVVNFG